MLKPAEIIGFLFGVGGIWLTIKKNIWCFPVGLVNVTITAWLVWNQQLYADFLQQVVYFILLIYGWAEWAGGKTPKIREISKSNNRLLLRLALIFILGSLLMGSMLNSLTDAAYPYADSTGTVICFIAQWMIAVKKIENWYLWIVANCMYIGIYFLKEMPFYSILSAIYLVMSFIGLWEWNKQILKPEKWPGE